MRNKPLQAHSWFLWLVALVITLAYGAFAAHADAQALVPAGVDKTDGYPRYVLEGPLDGDRWWVGDTYYSRDDLVKLIPFVRPPDINTRFECKFLCKDRAGYIAGINSQYLWMR